MFGFCFCMFRMDWVVASYGGGEVGRQTLLDLKSQTSLSSMKYMKVTKELIDWRVHGSLEMLLVQYICYHAIVLSPTNTSASCAATNQHLLYIFSLHFNADMGKNGQTQYNCLKCAKTSEGSWCKQKAKQNKTLYHLIIKYTTTTEAMQNTINANQENTCSGINEF